MTPECVVCGEPAVYLTDDPDEALCVVCGEIHGGLDDVEPCGSGVFIDSEDVYDLAEAAAPKLPGECEPAGFRAPRPRHKDWTK